MTTATLTPLLCRCGAPLGATDGRRLWIGDVVVAWSVVIACRKCHRRRTWRPHQLE